LFPGSNTNQEKTDLLLVGRLQKRKKVDILIDAFIKILPSINTNIRLVIVGDGEMRKDLEELVESYSVDNKRVVFTGTIIDEANLREIFHSSFVYVCPGDLGLGIVHAFAYGVPVVVPSIGHHGPEFANLENGINGILYDGTVDSLAEVLMGICKTPEKIKIMGEHAYKKYSEELTLDFMVEDVIKSIRHAYVR
jgi:glycosyltransferase involved in cell wall biosynthesis